MEGLHTCWLLWGNALLLACLACLPACCYPCLALFAVSQPWRRLLCCMAQSAPPHALTHCPRMTPRPCLALRCRALCAWLPAGGGAHC